MTTTPDSTSQPSSLALETTTHRCIGRSSGPVGLQGHLKATFRQEDAAEFLPAIQSLWLVANDKTTPLRISKWQHQHDDVWRLTLKGFTSRTQLEHASIGKGELWAQLTDIPPLEAGEFWLDDLVDCSVMSPDNTTALGAVVRWNEANGQTFLEIKLAQTGTHTLVPFTEGFFPAVDVARQTVTASAAIADFLMGEDTTEGK